jgi:hypothetical protein
MSVGNVSSSDSQNLSRNMATLCPACLSCPRMSGVTCVFGMTRVFGMTCVFGVTDVVVGLAVIGHWASARSVMSRAVDAVTTARRATSRCFHNE